MLQEMMLSYVIKKLWKLVRKHGLKLILQALIEMTRDQPEDYMQRLSRDLRTALENYENRYKH